MAERVWVKEESLTKLRHLFLEIKPGESRSSMYKQYFKYNTYFIRYFMIKKEWIWNSWGKTPNPMYAVHIQLYLGKYESIVMISFQYAWHLKILFPSLSFPSSFFMQPF